MKSILIFGATGSVGGFIYDSFLKLNYNVYGTSTNNETNFIHVNNNMDELLKIEKIDVVVWCQGYNVNDNILSFSDDEYNKIMSVNVLFIIKTLKFLLENDKLNNDGKMVIVSSIWEEFTRENKLSYTVSKAALSGLVKNLSINLSKHNILINNVLPGVIENEMSKKTLNEEQFDYIKNFLYFNRFISLEDVFNTVKFLCIENTGITGQSIKLDLGFTNIRKFN
jgi:NAD(P)-dependent dehydrogenase (short-subunit alcohol dehydrogenase family)